MLGFILSVKTCRSREDEVISMENRTDAYKRVISTIAGYQPIFIQDIEVRNKGENYGEKIFEKNTTFINPRIKAINLTDVSQPIEIKFFAPWGLSTGDISKNGYSYTDEVLGNADNWVDISGWGREEKGNWPAGDYRIEIWSKGNKLGEKSFKIYP